MATEPQLGPPIEWAPRRRPTGEALAGRHVVLRRVAADRDAEPLFAVSHPPAGDPAIWTYLPDGPFESASGLAESLREAERSTDPLRYTIVRASDDRPLGTASYLRITPEFGVI